MCLFAASFFFFFFNDTATTEIYTLSLHDALRSSITCFRSATEKNSIWACTRQARPERLRSEEHTSELQSHVNLVCRLLLEKKKKKNNHHQKNIQKKHKKINKH